VATRTQTLLQYQFLPPELGFIVAGTNQCRKRRDAAVIKTHAAFMPLQAEADFPAV
jgi:hypothetical protein